MHRSRNSTLFNHVAQNLHVHGLSKRLTPESTKYYATRFFIVFVAYVLAGKLGQATTNIRSSNLGPVWPAYGVALAGILLFGYRIWPAVALGTFLVAFTSPEPALTALGQAFGSTSAVLTGSFLLRRVADFDNHLSRLRDAVAMFLFGGLISAMVSASIGTFVLYTTNIHTYSGLASSWLIYWLGDSTGALLVTPLALTLAGILRIRRSGRLVEFGCLLLLLVAISAVVFDDLPVIPVRMLAFAVLPLVMWAAIRFGVAGAALSVFLIAVVATVQTTLGTGSFARRTPFINGVQLDIFFAILSLTALTFAGLYAEREQAERDRERSLREQVAIEVRLQDEEKLRASEERLRLAQQAARIGTFEWNLRTGVNTWTPELESIYGLSPGSFPGTRSAFEALLDPNDRRRVAELIESSLATGEPTQGEWQTMWPDGSTHWIGASWRVLLDESNKPDRVVGVNIDITEQKRAQQVLFGANRRLIEAQEQERRRIARELHDDISQRLAMLAVQLQQLQQDPTELDTFVPELRKQVTEISIDVQTLSHDLHSSKLEYLGVVPGIRSWCKEIAERRRIEIDFRSEVSSALPMDIGITLFRIAQEAVYNAIKHSGVSKIEVALSQADNHVELMVRDSGCGFDAQRSFEGSGLGLTSMRERVRLLNGTIGIHSEPMRGTTIQVSLPLATGQRMQRAAG